jgi:hypothetical protein
MNRGLFTTLRRITALTHRTVATTTLVAALVAGNALSAWADDLPPDPITNNTVSEHLTAAGSTSPEDSARSVYLAKLFDEVNERRDRAHTPRFEMMVTEGNEAVNAYLADLLPAMVTRRACFHGDSVYGMRAGWDYLAPLGIDTGMIGGEVLACPDTAGSGFWTPARIADGWWGSPTHQQTLYRDPRPIGVACGAEGPIRGGEAYETVACITLIGDRQELIALSTPELP